MKDKGHTFGTSRARQETVAQIAMLWMLRMVKRERVSGLFRAENPSRIVFVRK